MKTTQYLRILTLVGVCVSSSALGGDRSSIRGMGMGRTFNASSRSVDALGINPANLELDDVLPLTILPFQFGMRVSSEFLSYDLYQNYFTGVPDPSKPGSRIKRHLTTADENTLLSGFPDVGSFIRSDVEAQLAGLSVRLGKLGAIGFAVTEHFGTNMAMSKDYFRMAVMGLDSTGSNYNLSGTNLAAWWWREYNISYANRFPVDLPFLSDLYFGVGYKILRGYALLETEKYNSSFGTTINPTDAANGYPYPTLKGNFDFLTRRAGADFLDSSKHADFSPFADPAGKGNAFDFGLSGELMSGLRVAVSVTDMGSITWDKNTKEAAGAGQISINDPLSQTGQDSLKNAIAGKERAVGSFSTSLPTTLRLGATFQSEKLPFLNWLPGRMLLALDYNQGLNESMGNTKKPRLSAGMEYRLIPLIPLRTGISMGGGDNFRWAIGFGLDLYALSWDLSTENFGMLFSPKSFNMFSIATGLRVRL